MKRQWVDATSYSRGDKDRTPRIWYWKGMTLSVSVHRHRDYPGRWLVTCHDLGVEHVPLDATDLEEAKAEAVRFLADRVDAFLVDLGEVETKTCDT